ncbi:MAG TPA: Maf family protein, partial [Thermomonas sp.]|nr:Maf family protein [Thermomonas sp.]
MTRLLLASTSPYRRELLDRLRLPYAVERPEVDETPQPGEAAVSLAIRLGRAKAQAVAGRAGGDAWAIGSDQAADVLGQVLGKPGDRASAVAQLQAMRGQRVRFHTSVALAHADGRLYEALDLTEVALRWLDDEEIERYVDAE